MACSVSESSDEVASSNIKIRLSAKRALAMETRCFFAPRQLHPPFPHDGVFLQGQTGDKAFQLGEPHGVERPLPGRLRGWKRRCCCRGCRQRGCIPGAPYSGFRGATPGRRPNIGAVHGDLAPLHVVKAEKQADEGGFARPRGPPPPPFGGRAPSARNR